MLDLIVADKLIQTLHMTYKREWFVCNCTSPGLNSILSAWTEPIGSDKSETSTCTGYWGLARSKS
jgi:hypothetical protein